MKIFNYSTQSIDKNDIKSVVKTLNSKFLTKGSVTVNFEKKIKNFCKSKYACATINASASLLMACKSIGINKNDYVWTSNITYIASINCALHLGAKIKLIDIDQTNNIKAFKEKSLKGYKYASNINGTLHVPNKM